MCIGTTRIANISIYSLILASGLLSPSLILAQPAFFASTGHYYERIDVPAGIEWTGARIAAETMFFMGAQGHLATITSQAENDFIVENLGGEKLNQKICFWTSLILQRKYFTIPRKLLRIKKVKGHFQYHWKWI